MALTDELESLITMQSFEVTYLLKDDDSAAFVTGGQQTSVMIEFDARDDVGLGDVILIHGAFHL